MDRLIGFLKKKVWNTTCLQVLAYYESGLAADVNVTKIVIVNWILIDLFNKEHLKRSLRGQRPGPNHLRKKKERH